MPTLIAVPLHVLDPEAALGEATLARDLGANVVEFRLDGAIEGPESFDAIESLIARSPLPCIATCRPSWEGGHYEGDEGTRIDLFERLIASDRPPAHIDIELEAFARTPGLESRLGGALSGARVPPPRLIVSMHDFGGRPADLARRLLHLRTIDIASVHKVAFRARSLRDNLEILDILAQRDRPTIALAMGEFGLLSRVLAPKLGAYLTFASLRDASATAPGQPTIRELIDLYRFREISPSSRVFGIVGWPVSHSLSPAVHNAVFESARQDAVYLPLPIAADEGDAEGTYASLKGTLLDLLAREELALAGVSVTIPHKENLLRLAIEQRDQPTTTLPWRIEPIALRCGAANTLAVLHDHILVTNTDAPAALACLRNAGVGIASSRVVVMGAGGVGRAIAVALADAGAEVLLANRSIERSRSVVSDANAPSARLRAMVLDDIPDDADAYVNATPLGMSGGPAPGASPISAEQIARTRAGTVFFDTVYRDQETPMLEAAKNLGRECVDGLSMFVLQAAAQSELWLASPAPLALIERVARERLAR